MQPSISVIICTHNPRQDYLNKVLQALKSQTLLYKQWELLLVDNASDKLLSQEINLTWHPNARHIREEQLGLTPARLRGIKEAIGELLVFVDDDNVLHPDYLKNTIDIFQNYPNLGSAGGKSLPEFEVKPEPWVEKFWVCLALRDLGDNIQIYTYKEDNNKQHPVYAPIGAGMALRREAAEYYYNRIQSDANRLSFDRTGKSLQSGGDCDINLTLLEAGWAVGYFPQLQLTHLISANRLTKDYLARLNRASSRSWIKVLDAHDIRPWQKISPWTVLPRKIKAFFNYQPWKSPVAYIKWQGACGMFEGQAELI